MWKCSCGEEFETEAEVYDHIDDMDFNNADYHSPEWTTN